MDLKRANEFMREKWYQGEKSNKKKRKKELDENVVHIDIKFSKMYKEQTFRCDSKIISIFLQNL